MRVWGLRRLLRLNRRRPRRAAELPPRKSRRPAAGGRKRCEIAGKPGYLLSDGQTCVKFSGYVSAGVQAGAR